MGWVGGWWGGAGCILKGRPPTPETQLGNYNYNKRNRRVWATQTEHRAGEPEIGGVPDRFPHDRPILPTRGVMWLFVEFRETPRRGGRHRPKRKWKINRRIRRMRATQSDTERAARDSNQSRIYLRFPILPHSGAPWRSLGVPGRPERADIDATSTQQGNAKKRTRRG